tara:strand:- start:3416 stop:3790 length:375 start_codon:yes stop_codon:yes gene_type:complete
MNNTHCRNANKNYNYNNEVIDLESKLLHSEYSRDKYKRNLKTSKFINGGIINNIAADKIDTESNLKHIPILNQSKKSLFENKCLNRFETLYRDIQNPDMIIPKFEIGIGTRQQFSEKSLNKNKN